MDNETRGDLLPRGGGRDEKEERWGRKGRGREFPAPPPKSRRVENCPHTTGAAAAATEYKGVQK